MSRKLNHYIITIDVAESYEVEVDAASEAKAVKMAEQAVKNRDVEANDREIDVVDVFESQTETFIEE